MRIFMELSMQPKSEVMEIKNNLCLSEEESQVFDMLIFSNKSYLEIANRIHKSRTSTWRIMSRIRNKILNEYASRRAFIGMERI